MITIEVRGPVDSDRTSMLSLVAAVLHGLGCDVQVNTSGPVIAEQVARERIEQAKPSVVIGETRESGK